jgi:hypothetical protein
LSDAAHHNSRQTPNRKAGKTHSLGEVLHRGLTVIPGSEHAVAGIALSLGGVEMLCDSIGLMGTPVTVVVGG